MSGEAQAFSQHLLEHPPDWRVLEARAVVFHSLTRGGQERSEELAELKNGIQWLVSMGGRTIEIHGRKQLISMVS